MFALQSIVVQGPKLDAPQTDGFVTDGYSAFSKKTFNITMAQIESIVEPDCVADDIVREPVTFVGIHGPILASSTR